MRGQNINSEGDETKYDRGQWDAAEFVRHNDEEKDELCGQKEFEENDLAIFDGKSVLLPCFARTQLRENQEPNDDCSQRIPDYWRQIKGGQHGVEVGASALHDRNR